jgi:hypothetical protein
MSQEKNAPKSVKITTFDTSLQTSYALLIEQGEDANLAGINFISELADRMKNGLTQEIAKASMTDTAKGVRITPIVRASHIPSVTIASKIIAKYENEISDIKVAKILSLAVRVLADVKASKADAHIKKFGSFAELDENTLTKAESQARDKGEEIKDEMNAKADAITLESILENVDIYLNTLDLKTAKTADLALIHKVVARLITIEKNSKVA